MKVIKDNVIKAEKILWKDMKQLQKDSLKDLTKKDFDKLKRSIINNEFIDPFKVWEDKEGNIWNIDGTHRVKSLHAIEAEGIDVPEKLMAVFINCRDKKHAAKLVTIYSSIYARVQYDGLYEFISDYGVDIGEIKEEADIPYVDMELFNKSYTEEAPEEKKENPSKFICPYCAAEIEKDLLIPAGTNE